METVSLSVQRRERVGKGAARQGRHAGHIPAIFYGPRNSSIPVRISAKELATQVRGLEKSHLIRFQSPDPDLQDKVALLKAVQVHPVTGVVLHVDFYEVDLTKKIQVTVPLHFVGPAAGVARGGILQPIQREIQVECLPIDIPGFIEADVTPLDIHDALHVGDLSLPPGVRAIFETNFTVVTVLPPTVEEVKVEAVAAPEEPVPAAEAEGEGERKGGPA